MNPEWLLKKYSRHFPGVWEEVDLIHSERGRGFPSWPKYCFFPLEAMLAILLPDDADVKSSIIDDAMMHVADVLTSLAAWRVTKGVYRFDPDMFKALADTPLTDDIPYDAMVELREYCVYVETPGYVFLGKKLYGFFAQIGYNIDDSETYLHLILCFEELKVVVMTMVLGPLSLKESLEKCIADKNRDAKEFGEELDAESFAGQINPLVSLLLYICSDAKIGAGKSRPSKPKLTKTNNGLRFLPAAKVTVWNIGQKTGAAIRAASESDIHQAYWRGNWTEPVAGKKKYVLHWVSPVDKI